MSKAKAPAPPFDFRNFLKHASPRPGVYCMLDQQGELLYVGKAGNLKKRLGSYFRRHGLDGKSIALVNKIHDIETIITPNETEALLLEQNLIKERRPPYNIIWRDDKSYPHIYLSSEDDYPRLALHRGARKKPGMYFGPYPSAGAVRESLALLQKVFHVRQCEDSFFRNRTRPCLQYQIKRCSAPCVNLAAKEDYAEDVRHSILFLKGRNDQIIREMNARMEGLSSQLRFEEASVVRDQIKDLRSIQERQYAAGERGDVDIIAMAQEAGVVCVSMLFVRGGRVLGSKNHFPRFTLERDPAVILRAFIAQFYLRERNRSLIPGEIISSHKNADWHDIQGALAHVSGRKTLIKARVRGHRQQWLNLAQANAQHGLGSKLNSRQSMQTRLAALREALGLKDAPTRLECFDISHSGGEASVASCVVFDQNGPLKADYRRFNIEGISPGDDYAAMEQALKRRYLRLKKGEARLPDLLIIDGGKGQLRQAEKVLAELELEGVQTMGIAKGINRRAGEETLFLGGMRGRKGREEGEEGGEKGEGEEDNAKGQGRAKWRKIVLAAESPALHLLQHIRDESHRFALTAHRQRRGKRRSRSFLDDVPGVGPKKRRALLRHFGGQREIMKASVQELGKVPGISRGLAQEIYHCIHQ